MYRGEERMWVEDVQGMRKMSVVFQFVRLCTEIRKT